MHAIRTIRYAVAIPLVLASLVLPACAYERPDGAPGTREYQFPIERAVDVEAVSLLGRELYRPAITGERRERLEADLAEAEARHQADPTDEDAIIWLGRRLSYLGRYKDALVVYTHGLTIHPDSHKLLRHRGHRYITLRRFDAAVADLRRAADLIEGVPDEIEPDGAPNPLGIPRSTNHSNIYYHLALAHFLRGDFPASLEAWRRCMEFARVNDDMLVATADWTYRTLRRLGLDDEARSLLDQIHADMDVIENFAYHRLLLMYKGELSEADLLGDSAAASVEDATTAFGVAHWMLIEGREDEALVLMRRIVEGEAWAAFGFIAAEAELARRR